jgi:hypothetical protein
MIKRRNLNMKSNLIRKSKYLNLWIKMSTGTEQMKYLHLGKLIWTRYKCKNFSRLEKLLKTEVSVAKEHGLQETTKVKVILLKKLKV